MSKAYFAREALSSSGIKELLHSPLHYKTWRETIKTPSAAMRLGTALHSWILLGRREFPIFTETKTFQSKAGEAFLLAWPDGLTIEEWAKLQAMAKAVESDEKIMTLIKKCRHEVELYSSETIDGQEIQKKAMLDGLGSEIIIDLKTTSDRATDFKWTARRWKYDVQAAWYQAMALGDGVMRDFYFVVVESEAPYGVMLYQAGPEFISGGWEKCMIGKKRYANCLKSGVWPGYSHDSIQIL